MVLLVLQVCWCSLIADLTLRWLDGFGMLPTASRELAPAARPQLTSF
jgi:hypothetical protein